MAPNIRASIDALLPALAPGAISSSVELSSEASASRFAVADVQFVAAAWVQDPSGSWRVLASGEAWRGEFLAPVWAEAGDVARLAYMRLYMAMQRRRGLLILAGLL